MKDSRIGRLLAVVLSVTFGVGAVALAPDAQAQTTCDSADFTIGGEFDVNGYLACLSGTDSTPRTARPNESIVVVLTGFTPAETVKLVVEAQSNSTAAGDGTTANPYLAKADASGTIRVSVVMPAALGTYRIVAIGSTSNFAKTADVVVSESGSSPGTPGGGSGTPGGGNGLPATGSDVLRTVALGLGLVVLGAGAVVGTMRRRSALKA